MILDTLSSSKIFLLNKVQTQIASRPCGLRGLQFSSMKEDTARFLESCLTFEVLNLSNKGIDSDWTSNVLEVWASYDCVQLHPPSNPTQDGEAGCSNTLGAPTGHKLASLCGGWRREAAEATWSVSFQYREEQLSSPKGSHSELDSVGSVLWWEWRITKEQGEFSEHDSLNTDSKMEGEPRGP